MKNKINICYNNILLTYGIEYIKMMESLFGKSFKQVLKEKMSKNEK